MNPRKIKPIRLILLLAIPAVVFLAMIVPAYSRARIRGGPVCIVNLKMIQQAKRMYSDEFHLTNGVVLTREQLLPYGLGGRWPACPGGGEYSVGVLLDSPKCSDPKHAQLSVPTP